MFEINQKQKNTIFCFHSCVFTIFSVIVVFIIIAQKCNKKVIILMSYK